MLAEHDQAGGVPVIIRVYGLPVSAVAALRGDRAMAAIARLDALEAQMVALREETSARIFAILTDADPEGRRRLLKLKRDCFNGRPLRKHRQSTHWPSLQAWLGGDLGDRLMAIEDELTAARRELSRNAPSFRWHARQFTAGVAGPAQSDPSCASSLFV